MFTPSQDLRDLRDRCESLLGHHRRYGILDWPSNALQASREAQTQRVVTANDYLVALGELQAALLLARDATLAEGLRDLLGDLREIEEGLVPIAREAAERASPPQVDAFVEGLEFAVRMLGGPDDFQYELACRARSAFEYYVDSLDRLAGKGGGMRARCGNRVQEIDVSLREAQREFQDESVYERPFPRCPAYTPAEHWWYLR